MQFARIKTALETLSTLMVIVAAAGLVWTLFLKQQPAAAVAPPPISDAKGTIAAERLTNVKGSGRIAIVEFSDFQCPFCAKHAKDTVPALEKELADKARYIVVNLPLDIHPHAVAAAEAAECAAAQGKYWEMHDLLFDRQRELATAEYVVYAQHVGADPARMQACLTSDETLTKVKGDRTLADRLGVTGTPTTFIGFMRADGGVDLVKRINGAASYSSVMAVIASL